MYYEIFGVIFYVIVIHNIYKYFNIIATNGYEYCVLCLAPIIVLFMSILFVCKLIYFCTHDDNYWK